MNLFKWIERGISRVKQYFFMRSLLQQYGQQTVIDRFLSFEASSAQIGAQSPLWVCWWQGEAEMPEVVRACYHSIQMHAGQHPVILITSENQHKYLSLPAFIWQKHREGKISRTHLSDVARMYLLKEHGGIWVDITNFLTMDIDCFVGVERSFWSYRHITKYNNVSRGLWTSFFLASGKGQLIPTYIYESLLHFWQENDHITDYLLMDYIFKVGYDHIPAFKVEIDALPLQVIGTLRRVLCKAYKPKEWEFYCQQAGFQKLSYKKYMDKTTPKGEQTHYAYFLEHYLP